MFACFSNKEKPNQPLYNNTPRLMDRLNSNQVTINDEFWKESHGRRHDLLVAVRYNNDEAIMAVLKDPKLFKGRA